jgi:hypothetical protein
VCSSDLGPIQAEKNVAGAKPPLPAAPSIAFHRQGIRKWTLKLSLNRTNNGPLNIWFPSLLHAVESWRVLHPLNAKVSDRDRFPTVRPSTLIVDNSVRCSFARSHVGNFHEPEKTGRG